MSSKVDNETTRTTSIKFIVFIVNFERIQILLSMLILVMCFSISYQTAFKIDKTALYQYHILLKLTGKYLLKLV